MALSQVQCLDDNHVNPRTHESKPEFLYSEDQRLALEALLCDGREAFFKYLQDRGLRGFLSEPELETLAGAVEPRDPDTTELLPENAVEEGDCEPRLSLQYWPDMSDTSAPQMDLGWPDTKAYRGVTRATVYTQPPLDGQAHIKEVVRRTIAQAQKVIAVVMDVFTDVDIFRDLLDAGFKRKVSVYILLERTRLPHFLSMCQRANMHAGYLKHLRVRCAEGAEFCTRSCAKVKGQLGHRFMFVDGDKAVSGSYSFTWMASRLDRNLITVVTGQAVEGFDQLFRFLYLTSSFVDLRQVTTEPEPEPEPVQQPAAVAPPSAADVRKLYNPKYALVAAGNLITSNAKNNTKEPKNNNKADVLDGKKMKSSKDAIQEAPPLHPGLMNLEKASLISYLPIWPEPDPPSDVIGFINIRDSSKPTQVHLQRSEMFETSQAIRFSSPFSMPEKAPLGVAQPRQVTAKHENMNKPQSTPNETKALEPVVDSNRPVEHIAEPSDVKAKKEVPEQSLAKSVQNSEPEKDTNKTLNTENELHLNTTTKQNPGQTSCTASHVSEHSLSQSSSNSSTPNASNSSHTTPTVIVSSPKPLSPSGSIPEQETETSLNTQSFPAYLNSESHTQTKTEGTRIDSRTRALPMRPRSSPELTVNIQTVHSRIPTSSASPVQHQSVSPPSRTAINTSVVPSTSCSTPVPLLISSTTIDPPVPASSAASSLTMNAPIPKPRTFQLVIRNDATSDGQKLPEVSVVKRPESRDGTGPLVVSSETDVVQTQPEKEPETLAQVQVSTGVKPGILKDTASTGNPHQNQNVTSQETKDDEKVNTDVTPLSPAATKPQGQSDFWTINAPKAHSENNQEVIPKEQVENKSLMSSDSKTPPKTGMDCVATVQTDTKASDKTLIGNNQEVISKEKVKNKSLMSSDLKSKVQTDTKVLNKTLIGNNQEVIPKEQVKNKSLMSSDFKTPSKTDMDCVATVQTDTKALDKTLIGNNQEVISKEKVKNKSLMSSDFKSTVQTDTKALDKTLIGYNQEVIPEKQVENKSLISSDFKSTVQTDTKALVETLMGNNQEVIPKEKVKNKSLMSSDFETPAKTGMDCVATVQTDTKALDKTLIGNNQEVIPKEKVKNKSLLSSDFKSTVQTDTKALVETLIGNNQEVIPKEQVKNKSLMSSDFKTPSKTDMDCVATVQTDTKALDKTLIGNNQEVIPKEKVKNKSLLSSDFKSTVQTDTKDLDETLIGFGFTKEPNAKSEDVIRCKTYLARAHEPQIISYCELNSTVTDVDSRNDGVSARINSHTSNDSSQPGSPCVTPEPRIHDEPNIEEHNGHIGVTTQGSQKIPKAQGSAYTPERPRRLHLNTNMSELLSTFAEKNPQPPSPLLRTPTPDYFIPRTPTTDSRSHTPDPQNHTLDFRKPTPDMSDGYISPMDGSTLSTTSDEYYECVDSPSHYLYHGATVDCDSFPYMNASPLHMNNPAYASEAQSLSSSSLEKLDMGWMEMKARNEENWRQEDAKGIVADLPQEMERIGSNDRTTITDHFKDAKDLTEMTVNNKKTPPQVAKRKRVSNQSAAPRVHDGGVKTLAADLKPEKLSTDREKLVDEAAVRPSSVESRVRVQSSRDTQGQKSQLHASPSRSPRRPPSRPPPPQVIAGAVGSAKQKQAEVSHSKESTVSHQAPVANSRSKVRHLLNQQQSHPNTQASGPRARSNAESQLYRHFPIQELPPQESHRQEEGKSPFAFTFSKLYNLKGLKSKISHPQTKKHSSSSPAK